MVVTTFIDLIQTMVVDRLACMKKRGNRLFLCPDFVIHYTFQLQLPGERHQSLVLQFHHHATPLQNES